MVSLTDAALGGRLQNRSSNDSVGPGFEQYVGSQYCVAAVPTYPGSPRRIDVDVNTGSSYLLILGMRIVPGCGLLKSGVFEQLLVLSGDGSHKACPAAPFALVDEDDGEAEGSEGDAGERCPQHCSNFGVNPFLGNAVGTGAVPASLCEVDGSGCCDCNGEQRQDGQAVVGEPAEEDGADRHERHHGPAPGEGCSFRLQTGVPVHMGGRSVESHEFSARG